MTRKLFFLIGFLLLTTGALAQQRDPEGRTIRPTVPRSPEIQADGHVTFRLAASRGTTLPSGAHIGYCLTRRTPATPGRGFPRGRWPGHPYVRAVAPSGRTPATSDPPARPRRPSRAVPDHHRAPRPTARPTMRWI